MWLSDFFLCILCFIALLLGCMLVPIILPILLVQYVLDWWQRRKPLMIDGRPVALQLANSAIPAAMVCQTVAVSDPRFYPGGARCCHAACRRDGHLLDQMWQIECIVMPDEMQPSILRSIFLFACSEKCAAQFMLSFWEPPTNIGASL